MNIKEKAIFITSKLQQNGFQSVFAGGCVRDSLLGLEPKDYDIATNATPDEIENLFEKTIPVGKSFGVIIVVVDGEEFEVATFRNDGQYSDGRRPDSVSFSSMEEDAKRRDLTINGLFLDPITNKIYDFVGGKQDLENKIIRMIGDPNKRIEEDKLRMLRVIRFSVKFNFTIDEETFHSVYNHSSEITQVSQERIFDELNKLFTLKNRSHSLDLLLDLGLLKQVLPEVVNMVGCKQPPQFHHVEAKVRKIL